MRDLGSLGGSSEALGLNDSAVAVGYSFLANGHQHVFRWTAASGMQDLGTLGGTRGSAYAVNAAGQIAGWAHTTGGVQHAFLWTAGGTDGPASNPQMRDLGTLGGLESWSSALNNNGQVVGTAQLGGLYHAFVWTAQAGMKDLNTLIPAGSGWELVEARGINDSGQITGSGFIGGQRHAFLLTAAVAEPSTWALLVAGSAAFVGGYYMWQRQRRNKLDLEVIGEDA
jgi:probable HAF family extracellular repeat protein